jgi:hypothetical protein
MDDINNNIEIHKIVDKTASFESHRLWLRASLQIVSGRVL